MGKNRRRQQVSDVAGSPTSTQRRQMWMPAGVIVLVFVCAAGITVSRFREKGNAAASPLVHEQQPASRSTAGLAQNALSKAERQTLVGRWRRSDANYVLEIHDIAADGRIDAAYLNPKPIHVFKAVAASESGKMAVIVELRDRLYPGSYYTLAYDASKDCLAGVYHHLGVQKDFDVVFHRIEWK